MMGVVAVGLGLTISAWLLFSNEGYGSPLLFLVGIFLFPIGLFTIATALTGGMGQGALSMLMRYRYLLRALKTEKPLRDEEEKSGQATKNSP